MLPELYLFLSSGEIMDSVWFDREEHSAAQQGVQYNFFEPHNQIGARLLNISNYFMVPILTLVVSGNYLLLLM